MNKWLTRTILLLGEDKVNYLQNKHVLVVGLGGVGAYAAELIARAGVGKMTIVDGDCIQPGNLNRQLLALHSTLNKPKALLMADRLKDINPDIELTVYCEYLRDERMVELLKHPFDFVVDAIDTLSPKIYLIFHAVKNNWMFSGVGSYKRFTRKV